MAEVHPYIGQFEPERQGWVMLRCYIQSKCQTYFYCLQIWVYGSSLAVPSIFLISFLIAFSLTFDLSLPLGDTHFKYNRYTINSSWLLWPCHIISKRQFISTLINAASIFIYNACRMKTLHIHLRNLAEFIIMDYILVERGMRSALSCKQETWFESILPSWMIARAAITCENKILYIGWYALTIAIEDYNTS